MMINPPRSVSSVGLEPIRPTKSLPPQAPVIAEREDRVTLSPAARERKNSDSEEQPSITLKRASQSHLSLADQATFTKTDKQVKELAFQEDRAQLDTTDAAQGTGPVRYAATGEVVSAESDAKLAEKAANVRQGRIALYQSEKAKGTPPSEIYEKIANYMSNQTPEYLRHTGWTQII